MHMLITIYDIKPLTDAQLDVLDCRLRHILTTATLTDIDRANIRALLDAIRDEQAVRLNSVNSHGGHLLRSERSSARHDHS